MDNVLPALRAVLRRSRRTALVISMTAAMLCLALLIGHPFLDSGPFLGSVTLPWWVLAIGFAATEIWVVHLQAKRESQNVALSELPLVLGLFFASPLQLLIGRLAGTAAVMVLHRRSSPLKTTWNQALITLQTVVTVALFDLFSQGHDA